jgi:uncharacterized protein YeaO (DUF488 family)
MIYTGSWFKKYPPGFKKVSICLSSPKGMKCDQFESCLAPKGYMLKLAGAEYEEAYEKVLRAAFKGGVIKRLVDQGEKENIVLLCWEIDRTNCHRLIVANFIEQIYKVRVPEWYNTRAPMISPQLMLSL